MEGSGRDRWVLSSSWSYPCLGERRHGDGFAPVELVDGLRNSSEVPGQAHLGPGARHHGRARPYARSATWAPSSMWARRSAIGRFPCSRFIAKPSLPFEASPVPPRKLIHDRLHVHLTWSICRRSTRRNPTGRSTRRARTPSRSAHLPNGSSGARFFAATHRRLEVWAALPMVKVILANRIAPGFLHRISPKPAFPGSSPISRSATTHPPI